MDDGLGGSFLAGLRYLKTVDHMHCWGGQLELAVGAYSC